MGNEPKKRGGVRKVSTNQKEQRRKRDKYTYLNPKNSLMIRQDETEDVASYVDQLNEEEKAWMNQFMKEYVNAHTKDAVFHTSKEDRKICHDKNNARNRCWFSKENAQNRLNLVESDEELERLIYTNGELDEETGYDSEIE